VCVRVWEGRRERNIRELERVCKYEREREEDREGGRQRGKCRREG
jgi:hypothetical protein